MFLLVNSVWALPVVTAILTPLLAKMSSRLRDAAMVTTGGTVAAIVSYLAVSGWSGSVSVEWVRIPGLGSITLTLLVDNLSLTFASITAWVSLAVFVYSLDHLREDPGATRYALLLLLFLGSMELLVLSGDVLLLLYCWELVSVCSFLLISYWYQDSESLRRIQWVGEPPEEYPPSHCGIKAFLTTRFADAFMIVGTIILAVIEGSSSILELRSRVPSAAGSNLLLPLLLMAIGAMGKSAQVPFLEWLPDAMAGPSGVSALIHAATMVKAGVYLVARLSQLALAWNTIVDARSFFSLIAWSGAITLLVAALQASTASELKKTLAYSTASHIGYMMAALGACWYYGEEAVSAAVMHTVSHAFFKSSLFLAAGVIIHAEGTRFYRDLMGAGRKHKLAYATILLAAMSLMGVPPFAGYWSKERILSALYPDAPLFALALFSTAITAFYTARMLTLLAGSTQHETRTDNPTEVLPGMVLALVGLAIGVSYALSSSGSSMGGLALTGVANLALLTLGASLALLAYKGRVALHPPAVVLSVLKRRFYVNALYYRIAGWTLSLAKSLQKLEGSYNHALKLGARLLVEDFGKISRVQVGVINLRELLWVLALLMLLLLVLLGW